MVKIDDYNFVLPEELIAKEPASPRDSARLFVYDTRTDTVSFDTFRNIGNHLPARTLLVMNDTKVVPARLWLTKETGGKIEVLLFMNEYRPGDELLKGIVDRKVDVGAKLYFPNESTATFLEVARQDEQFFFFRPAMPVAELYHLLEKSGTTPIPPYIKNTPLPEDALRERYQSIFARNPASVAAPTASLHFTPALLEELSAHGRDRAFVTLHVGAGTFAPIDEKNLKEKRLFVEYYGVTPDAAQKINSAKDTGISVIPVGTTACRTLESAGKSGRVIGEEGPTDIFIFPPYKFAIVDGLVTNFHIPRSSLLLLVDALLEHKGAKRRILDLYAIAIRERFRFYSFGDAMFIL